MEIYFRNALANLPHSFSMKVALFSFLLKNKSTQNMTDIKSAICILKLENIFKAFVNIS